MKIFMVSANETPDDFALVVGVIPIDDFRNGTVQLEKPIEGVEVTNEGLRALGIRLIEDAAESA